MDYILAVTSLVLALAVMGSVFSCLHLKEKNAVLEEKNNALERTMQLKDLDRGRMAVELELLREHMADLRAGLVKAETEDSKGREKI